ncbi:PfkB family carbohydrate kinase [Teredinibacter turnerae]|uniref:PfkB family carbohydrate kinase n=1 Tax=Teredinibacter turnerae TaxID=2426 RepID=UPI000378FC97|nr:PfkB family carbohydrate kinase [Teredinibacter turnerae]
MTISVIGGVYKECCAWPAHESLQGSAGRAALCLAQLDKSLDIELYTQIAKSDEENLKEVFAFNKNCNLNIQYAQTTTKFDYFHPLSEPKISPLQQSTPLPSFSPIAESVEAAIIFGMIEANPVVTSETAVYDPQNTYNPVLFSEMGCKADRLAYVTNKNELKLFFNKHVGDVQSVEVMAKWLYEFEKANVVVVKCGDKGAFIYSPDLQEWVLPYKTDSVFPIGSGDSFVASFAYYWIEKELPPIVAAKKASAATAHYVSSKTMAPADSLDDFAKELSPIEKEPGTRLVYLAGPFFTLAELWMINEAKFHIESAGMKVFSPYHDIGIGTADQVVHKDIEAIKQCDVVYAVFNGTDPGTLFEVGYARSINKPVVILAENPKDEELKMYDGSGCVITSDFASSMYRLAWV